MNTYSLSAPKKSPRQKSGRLSNHSRQVLATLIRLLGDFEMAEEAIPSASNIPPARLDSVELRPIRELPPKK